MNLGGMIAGGLAGAGEGMMKMGMAEMQSALEVSRQEALARLQSELRISEDKNKRELDLEYIPKTAAANAQAQKDNSGMIGEAEANKASILAKRKVATDLETQPTRQAIAKSDALAADETAGTIATRHAGDTKRMAAERKIKENEQVESKSSLAQAALANFQLDRAKLVGAAQDALALAQKGGDKSAIEAARLNLEALNSKGDDPKSASTSASIGKAYMTLADKEIDETKKADYIAKAKDWFDQASSQMNIGGSGKIVIHRGADGKLIPPGGAAATATPAAKQGTGMIDEPANKASGGYTPRRLENKSSIDLQRIASRPKGVSTAEAQEAQQELDIRRTESRMSAG